MDAYKTWLAFLSVDLIEQCISRLKLDCPGCREGLLSPLLHRHTHFNLLETIKEKMQEAVQEMDVNKVYTNFLIKFTVFDLPQEEMIQLGQSFLRFSTPEAVYFGNYITKENEKHFYPEPQYDPTPLTKRRKTTTED